VPLTCLLVQGATKVHVVSDAFESTTESFFSVPGRSCGTMRMTGEGFK
jgi:hypothetical protein